VAVWAVAAGADDRRAEYALARHVTVVGWSDTGDLSDARRRDTVRDRLARGYPTAPADAIDSWGDQLWAFINGIAEGDMVAMRLGREAEVAFGRVTGPYRYDETAPGNRRHQRTVRWVRHVPWASLEPALQAELQNPAAVHRLRDPGSALVEPEPAGRPLSRRAFFGAGAAAAAAAAIAAIWRPWDSSSSPTARHTPISSRGGHGSSGVSSSPNGPVAQWVKDENAKPGTTAWNVTNGGKPGDLEGYASVVSAQRGDTVTLYVSTTAPTVHVEAYRMGWYKGLGGRLIWHSSEMPGKKQAAPTFTPGINMTEARWDPSLKVSIDSQYPPGVYMFKLVGSNGIQQLVPLTVRDDTSTATYVVQNSVTSWQAYNDWAGYSLYVGPNGAYATRARVVSFDRPYARGDGQADFLGLEFPLIMMMEQLGLDVTYITDVDTHVRPQLLLNHKMWFSLGHDEYWSKEMRDGVEGARDKGVNLAFLGANAAFRQIRFEPSAIGPNRHQVCYKSAPEDPIHATNPVLTTVNWREAPVSRPESEMIGQQYECNPVNADMVIVDPTAWVFNGTGVKAGQKLPNAVGSEYDRFDPAQAGPKNVQIFAHSPVVCHGHPSFADMTYYTAPSGAGVFSTGTIVWITKLTPPRPNSPNDAVATQVTKNVIAAFGTGPAARQHQPTPNYAAVARQYGSASGAPQGTD
jgi:hypothetical protein